LEHDNEEKFVELNKKIDKYSLEKQPNSKHVQDPPYPGRLTIEKSTKQYEFDFCGELKNVCVKITLFQAIKYVPIYAKYVRELCLKKSGRKQKYPPIVRPKTIKVVPLLILI
jgi:hypothetical protein